MSDSTLPSQGRKTGLTPVSRSSWEILKIPARLRRVSTDFEGKIPQFCLSVASSSNFIKGAPVDKLRVWGKMTPQPPKTIQKRKSGRSKKMVRRKGGNNVDELSNQVLEGCRLIKYFGITVLRPFLTSNKLCLFNALTVSQNPNIVATHFFDEIVNINRIIWVIVMNGNC